jgi:hypothetical protein
MIQGPALPENQEPVFKSEGKWKLPSHSAAVKLPFSFTIRILSEEVLSENEIIAGEHR